MLWHFLQESIIFNGKIPFSPAFFCYEKENPCYVFTNCLLFFYKSAKKIFCNKYKISFLYLFCFINQTSTIFIFCRIFLFHFILLSYDDYFLSNSRFSLSTKSIKRQHKPSKMCYNVYKRVEQSSEIFLKRESVFMSSLISADNTWVLWGLLVGDAALAIWLEQKFKWASKITGCVLALLGMICLLYTSRCV